MRGAILTVCSRGIDVFVAMLESNLNGFLYLSRLRLPGAEADGGHLSTGVECHESAGGHDCERKGG